MQVRKVQQDHKVPQAPAEDPLEPLEKLVLPVQQAIKELPVPQALKALLV